MGNFPPLDWSHPGKSCEDSLTLLLSVPRLKMAMRVSQLADPELRMEMAVGQGQQSGGRYNTNHREWFSRMVGCRFAGCNLFSLMNPAVVTKGIISEHEARQLFQM